MQWWGIACGRLKKMCFLFFYSTDAVLLPFFFFLACDPWLVVVGCLQVWAACMSLSPFLFVVVFLFLFFFLFVEADLRHLSQSDKSKTQKSEQGEKHTNKDCLFVYLEKKVSQVTEVFSVEMRWLFIWCCFFLLPQRPDNCIHLLNCTWVFILPSLSSSDVKGLGMVSAELF